MLRTRTSRRRAGSADSTASQPDTANWRDAAPTRLPAPPPASSQRPVPKLKSAQRRRRTAPVARIGSRVMCSGASVTHLGRRRRSVGFLCWEAAGSVFSGGLTDARGGTARLGRYHL